jgi:hypothetical protein
MKAKLKDLKEDFYAFSSKTSDITRQLALAGIAIIWIFKISSAQKIELAPSTVPILKLLIVSLLLDFCHAFIPSITYGILSNGHRKNGKTDESEVAYSLWWTLPEWFFFIAKIALLLWAYVCLWRFLNSSLM